MSKSIAHYLSAATLAAATFAAGGAAHAQQASQPQWVKVCSKAGETDICNVQYNVLTPQGRLITGVNLLTSTGKVKRRIFQVAVPTGRYIPEGVKIKIDEGKENTLPYSICLPDRCIAEVGLSNNLVNALKAGGKITLTSTNFRTQKNPVNVTLSGFTAAFDGAPIKQGELDDRKKKLEEELQKKAEETRKKLEEAQQKAKDGG
ncbi:invasion associated locus B family protein [Pseudahrensia aquimaris]|uniref:Invasion associated locus B family protein n=2 Tax=Pseudahrensia aquimaris TaxID=744461 RepID=A0ABW3FJY0_9HYPH